MEGASSVPIDVDPPDASFALMEVSASGKSHHFSVPEGAKSRTDGRKKFTTEQTKEMEALFQRDTHPARDERTQLAERFNVPEKSVGIWFQNRRQAMRRDKMGLGGSVSKPAKQGRGRPKGGMLEVANEKLASSTRVTLESAASSSLLPSPRRRPAADASQDPNRQTHIWGHMMSSLSPPSSPVRHAGAHLPVKREDDGDEEEEIDELEDDTIHAGSEFSRASPRSRTRSQSPQSSSPTLVYANPHLHIQPQPHPTLARVRNETFSRSKSEHGVGPQRTVKRAEPFSNNVATSSSGGGRARRGLARHHSAAPSYVAKPTLEWACAKASRLPPGSPESVYVHFSASAPPETDRSGSPCVRKADGSAGERDLENGGEDASIDDMTTETEMDACTEFSDETEATGSQGSRSLGSFGSSTPRFGAASTSASTVSSASPQSSWSSEISTMSTSTSFSAASTLSSPSANLRVERVPALGPFAKKAADMLGAAGLPRSFPRLPSGMGRTVRNPHAPPQDSRSESNSHRRGGSSHTAVSPTSRFVPAPAFVNSPDEIEAALALCGLITSGNGDGGGTSQTPTP